MAKMVKVIPPKAKYGNKKQDITAPKLKVAAYARVSTDSDEQATSYEAQVEHYEQYIRSQSNWIFVDVYADDGISGTNTKKRDEFNRMIQDCQKGKIDMILTKSISRFARNTLDCLKYIRLLKEHYVSVFFEKENINTMDAKGEVLLTIMASLAQQESESLSQNVKLGFQYRYQKGEVMFNHNRFLGYTKDEEGKLIIKQEDAKIVKRIYREYLEGASLQMIKVGLEKDGIRNGAGNKKWHTSNILQILTNEKYMGDALLQKTYTVDFLNKKRAKNEGIVPQYYVENNHPPIIPKGIFLQVQAEKERRAQKRQDSKTHHFSSKYALSHCVKCEQCGQIYRRITWQNRGVREIVWRCVTRVTHGPTKCSARTIKELDLHQVVVDAMNKMAGNRQKLLKQIEHNLELASHNHLMTDVEQLDTQLDTLQARLVQAATDGKRYDEIVEQLEWNKEKKQQLLLQIAETKQTENKLNDLRGFLEHYTDEVVTEYDDTLTRKLIEEIEVKEDGYEVVFRSGEKTEVDRRNACLIMIEM